MCSCSSVGNVDLGAECSRAGLNYVRGKQMFVVNSHIRLPKSPFIRYGTITTVHETDKARRHTRFQAAYKSHDKLRLQDDTVDYVYRGHV